jgi:phage repressor protein C with HTH and peptisase S24 domain
MKRSPLSFAAVAAALTVLTGAALAADAIPTDGQTLQTQEQNTVRARQQAATEGQAPLKLQLQERQHTQLQTQQRTHATDGAVRRDGTPATTRIRTQAQVHQQTRVQLIPEAAGARAGGGAGGAGSGKGR